jgi:hypothetical protein
MDVLAGSTDITTYFVLRLSADGTEATGLTVTNFDLQYVRSGETPAAKADATALAATNSAHTDNAAIEIDATDQPGLYRVDWPDAAFASGAREVILSVKCATCFTEHLRVNLTPVPSRLADIATHGGTSTVITFERLVGASTTSNEPCVKLTGNGSGEGLLATGGTSGSGVHGVSGSGPQGAGIRGTATNSASTGIDGVGGSSGSGIKGTGGTAGIGGTGSTNGSGFLGLGAGTGHGIRALGGSSNAHGAFFEGQGSGQGLRAQGGLTGSGAVFFAGNTGGYGFEIDGTGNFAGLLVTGGSGGSSGHGMHLVRGSSSADDLYLNNSDSPTLASIVNAEVLDVLNVDTFAEPTGAPGATVTLSTKIGYVYMALRNKLTVTATTKAFYDDGGSIEWSKTLTDDGTTYTEAEGA